MFHMRVISGFPTLVGVICIAHIGMKRLFQLEAKRICGGSILAILVKTKGFLSLQKMKFMFFEVFQLAKDEVHVF